MSEKNVIDEIHKAIQDKKLATPNQIIGCSEEEIENLMAKQRVNKLPRIYRAFLATFGKGAGKLWSGSAYTYEDLKELKTQANNLLKINGNPITLPIDAFVFHMQDGIIFYYFISTQEHPSVYVYSEINYTHKKVDENLSNYLRNVW